MSYAVDIQIKGQKGTQPLNGLVIDEAEAVETVRNLGHRPTGNVRRAKTESNTDVLVVEVAQ